MTIAYSQIFDQYQSILLQLKKKICLEEIGTISILLANRKSIKLLNIAIILEYNSNQIFLR